jgi:hypothetical protein
MFLERQTEKFPKISPIRQIQVIFGCSTDMRPRQIQVSNLWSSVKKYTLSGLDFLFFIRSTFPDPHIFTKMQ